MINDFDAKEYRLIIDYIQNSKPGGDFEPEALAFLKKLVDFDQGFFVVSKPSAETVKAAYGHSADAAAVKGYGEAYYHNAVRNSAGSQHYKGPESTSKEAGYNRFFRINENGEGIHLFRGSQGKPFSEIEISRGQYLASIIGNEYGQHLETEEILQDASSFRMLLNCMYFGTLIFDQNFSLIKANKPGIVRMSAVTGKVMAGEMVADFAEIMKTMLNEEKKVEKHLTIYKAVENYIIELIESHDFDESQNLATHYIVFIYKKEWFNSMMTSSLDEVINQYDLTDREKQLVYLIVCGYSNSQIADELFISLYTVKEHIKSIFRKMNLNSRGELIIKVYSERN